MEAGRDLDKMIAEEIFGLELTTSSNCGRIDWFYKAKGGALVPVPRYSEHIACAMEVIAKVMPKYQRKISIETYEGEIWNIKPCGTSSRSLPHAICLAALKLGHVTPK